MTRRPPAPQAAVWVFAGPLADAIHRFKYASRTELAGQLGACLLEGTGPYRGNVDCVVPLPLHPRKLRQRGYNPAALLAAPLARALGVPLDVHVLRRVLDTATQAGLPRAARLENVRDAFVARPALARRVLLVDDVLTTGATASEASRALVRAGHHVASLALAWAQDAATAR